MSEFPRPDEYAPKPDMKTPVAHIDDAVLDKYLVPRFLACVQMGTASDPRVDKTPSTETQWDLARYLAEELRKLGVADVTLTEHCYVIARLPATPGREQAPVFGLLAHLDTSPDAPGDNVRPVLVRNYDGGKIALAGDLSLDPETENGLAAQKGRDIIHTDGTTLLGADDKAGIAAIMGAVEYLLAHPKIEHGSVEIIFTPDEETGKGLPEFPLDTLRSTACYTLDGGGEGELEIECFNAYCVEVRIKGRVIHPGTARGVLINAALMASCFAAMLPRSESPEATDGYYGYYYLTGITGNQEDASLELLIRDFDAEMAKRRVAALDSFARAVEAQFPGGKVTVDVKPQYYNMRKKIEEKPLVMEKLKTAMENLGLPFKLKPVRGGTDGSRLTELGIPTPNIFTGGRNFHSRMEWLAVSGMISACRLVIELIRLWGLPLSNEQ